MKMTFWNRPWGRFFYALAMLGACWTAASAGTLTRISDVIYRADGTPARGTVVITWPAFSTDDSRAIAAGSLSVAIGSGGQLTVALVPNSGSTPAGTYYKVVYKLDDGSTSEEYWSVPASATTTLSAIRSKIVPSSVAMQVVSRQYVDSSLAAKADNSGVVHTAGDETISGTKQFTQSPQVPAPTGDNSAVTKLYVDSLAPMRGVTSFNGRTGAVTSQANDYAFGQLSGVVNANQVVAGTVNGGRCLQTSADGAQINETVGGCGGTSSNATQIQGRNVCTDPPSDGNAVVWEAVSNCYKPKPGGSSNADMVDGIHAAGFAQVTSDTPTQAQVPAYDAASGKYKPQAKSFTDVRDYSNSISGAMSAISAGSAEPTVLIPRSFPASSYPFGSSLNNTGAWPILDYGGQDSGYAGTLTGHSIRKRFLTEFGFCDGTAAHDTAILNAAFANPYLLADNGNATLVIDGGNMGSRCNFNNPTWPSAGPLGHPLRNYWLRLEVDGEMYISGKWVPPQFFALFSNPEKIGTSPAQFQAKPNSSILCWTTSEPCLQFASNTYLANLKIGGKGGISSNSSVIFGGAAQNGGAIARIENVSFGCDSTANVACVPLTFDGFQWAWMDHVSAFQGLTSPTTPAAIHLTNTGSYSQNSGNLHINHAQVAGYGILHDSSIPVNWMANEEFNDIVFESLVPAAVAGFTFDTTNAAAAGAIRIHQFQLADSNVPCVINVKGPNLQSIHVDDSFYSPTWCYNGNTGSAGDGPPMYAHFGEAVIGAGAAQLQLPTAMKKYVHEHNGVLDAENNALEGSYPMAVPHAAWNVLNQEASTWTSNNGATVSTGQLDPWGGTNAAKLTYASGPGNWVLADTVGATLSAGGWFIYGVCLRPDPASGNSYGVAPMYIQDLNNNVVWDDLPSSHSTQLGLFDTAYTVGHGWECVSHAAKVTTGGSASLRFMFSVQSGHPALFSYPWVMWIPQSEGYSDREVIRWSRMLRAVPGNAVAGQVYMPGGVPMNERLPVCRLAADGVTDDTNAVAACMGAGKHVRLPSGTIILHPDTLTVADNLALEGAGRGVTVLKIKNSAGSYNALFAGSASNVSVRHLTIDQNSSNNALVSGADILAHPRNLFSVTGGDRFTLDDVEFVNSNNLDGVVSVATNTSITNCRVSNVGGGSVFHDHSFFQTLANKGVIANNVMDAGNVANAGAVTAIEVHGSGFVVSGNTIENFQGGVNIGVTPTMEESTIVTGNVIRNALFGVHIYSSKYNGQPTSGYGTGQTIISNNIIRLNQLSRTIDVQSGIASLGNPFGVGTESYPGLPLKNIKISDNDIEFDLENSASHAVAVPSASGIILWDANNSQKIDDLTVTGNNIVNAPLAGIWSNYGGSNHVISRNTIIRPGSALYAVDASYHTGISLTNASAVTGAYEVANNVIVDNLATSRLVRGITLASAVPIKVHLPGNVVTVSGSTNTSYLKPIDDYNFNTDIVWAEITQTLPALTASYMPNALLAPTSRITDGASGKWWTAISTGAMIEGAYSAINSQFKLHGNPIIFSPNNTDQWLFNWDGVLAAYTDNSVDIGYAAANRPRTVYAGTSVVAPAYKVGNTTVIDSNRNATFNSITVTGTGGTGYDFTAGTIAAANDVVCPSANATVSDCATTLASNQLGIALAASGTVTVQVDGPATFNLDATASPAAGDRLCLSTSTAGKVHSQSTACSAGQQVGIVTTGGSSVSTVLGMVQIK